MLQSCGERFGEILPVLNIRNLDLSGNTNLIKTENILKTPSLKNHRN